MDEAAPDFGDGPPTKRHTNTRPKAAASLIIADLSGPSPQFLMGQRSDGHVFMPRYFVFPGGKLERSDYNACRSLNTFDSKRLSAQTNQARLPSALVNCAIRETLEETGLDLSEHQSPIRYIGRAITPPAQIRRYDTRFFLTIIDRTHLKPIIRTDDELLSIGWFEADAIPPANIHRITQLMFEATLARLKDDPRLDKNTKTPIHRFRYGKALVEWE